MVSIGDSQPPLPSPTSYSETHSSSSISSSNKIQRSQGRSMRTIRSNFSCSFPVPGNANVNSTHVTGISEILTDSVMDFRLVELASAAMNNEKSCFETDEFRDLSQAFSDFSSCSSDISGELQRLSCIPSPEALKEEAEAALLDQEPWLGFLQKGNLSSEIFDGISPENLEQAVKICLEGLESSSIDIKRSAAAKLRFLAKNRSENRAVIGESGAISALIPLLRCNDPWTQEHAVTALFNLSLHEENKILITDSGAIKPLVYVLKTGTETSKQNAACALLSLSLIEDNKISIGVCGAIPPLVSLILNGSNRGKKDALTTLYKLCTIKQNKERAVTAGAVKPLVDLISEQGSGLSDKAMVVLSSLAGLREGKNAIVDEGGIPVLVESIEDGSVKGKEFAVLTLLQLCANSVRNRAYLVGEGAIPPLVSLSQSGTTRAKHKAEILLKYLREPRQEASSSSP
ncbi:U-box domain-containing protein [Thalictrum thalictroides]|uniref:U-box domain-containing protein n=1 Tax=Thalictrum thalictroides TaxID=46969 RepID=A0A7J6XDJ0_THATH|nr:U-box domain-containing protein [Thalictrum thalictroides]